MIKNIFIILLAALSMTLGLFHLKSDGKKISKAVAEKTSDDFDGIAELSRGAAVEFIDRYDVLKNWKVSDKNSLELAIRLNAIVFSHCENKSPHTGKEDINQLFRVCRTSCGGYSYVLRGLLEAYGLKTRYLNLYNMPNQGNHTAVEVLIGNQWIFLDPTFGTIFPSRKADFSALMTIDEVRYHFSRENIQKGSTTALRKSGENYVDGFMTLPMGEIYKRNSFDFAYMKAENYLLAETTAFVGRTLPLPFLLNIDMAGSRYIIGDVDAKKKEEAEAYFLVETNKKYMDRTLENDISYKFKNIGVHGKEYQNIPILKFKNLKVDSEYKIRVVGYNSKGDFQIALRSIGRELKLQKTMSKRLSGEKFVYVNSFFSKKEDGQMILSLIPGERGFVLSSLEICKSEVCNF